MKRSTVRPGRIIDLSKKERLALCRFATGALIVADGEAYTVDPAGCDLSGADRWPLLIQHSHHADSVIGVSEHAEIHTDHVLVVVRLSKRPCAEEYWQMLLDDMPLGCSFGYSIFEAKEASGHKPERPHYVVTRWEPYEVSVVALPGDRQAHITRRGVEKVAAQAADRMARRIEAERAAAVAALKGDRWRTWARNGACTDLSTILGVDAALVEPELARLVDHHLAELEGMI